MTTEALPQLPEVQTSMAELLASADRRFEAAEPSTWFTEMNQQLNDFEASGYQCLEILHPGEDNPTADAIEESTRHVAEQGDVTLLGAIRGLTRAMRRQAKAAVGICPVNGQAYADAVVSEVTADDAHERKVSRRLKPEVYGRFGPMIRDAVRLTFERRKDPALGEFGLYANTWRRPADRFDVSDWYALQACWGRSLIVSVRDVVDEREANQDQELIALNSLFGRYQTLSGADPTKDVTAENQLEGGCGTAVRACMRLAYAMDAYLIEEKGIKDPGQRAIIIKRSHGPIGSVAGLDQSQIDAFSETYLGADIDKTTVTDFSKIRTDMLELGGNGRINFVQPADELPLPVGVKVGLFGAVARRIGCPILLTPRLVQGLWGAFVDSAAQAKLI